MAEGEDWLDAQPSPFASEETVAVAKVERARQARDFAQLYRVFTDDERGRQLLAHWDEALLNRRVPVNALIQEYAAVEAVRDFVATIHREIERSHT